MTCHSPRDLTFAYFIQPYFLGVYVVVAVFFPFEFLVLKFKKKKRFLAVIFCFHSFWLLLDVFFFSFGKDSEIQDGGNRWLIQTIYMTQLLLHTCMVPLPHDTYPTIDIFRGVFHHLSLVVIASLRNLQ